MSAPDVRIPLGRRQAGVTQELLYSSEVGSSLEQVRGKRVAQRVRSDPLLACQSNHLASDEPSNRSICQSTTVSIDEHRIRLRGPLATHSEIVFDGSVSGSTEWHEPLFPSLAQESDKTARRIELGQIESHEFGAPRPRRIEQLENGAAADVDVAIPRYFNQLSNVLFIQPLWQPSFRAGRADKPSGIAVDILFPA
jgi:hypothetical protein